MKPFITLYYIVLVCLKEIINLVFFNGDKYVHAKGIEESLAVCNTNITFLLFVYMCCGRKCISTVSLLLHTFD